MTRSFLFGDSESTGLNLDFDQILQYAAVRTDENLNIDQNSVMNLLCRPRLDVVPHPQAYLTHHIDIDLLLKNGVSEFEFARRIRNYMLSTPQTVLSGYNTIAYDDEMVRRLFLRQLRDPYEHEYKNGNHRFDVFKLVQLIYAIRPEILAWPTKDDGSVSMKLDRLTVSNGINHEGAHDALADVLATIDLARLIKQSNEKAFHYALSLCNKDHVKSLLLQRKPLLHVARYGDEFRNSSVIYPLIVDRTNRNKFICIDLRADPEELLHLSTDEIRKYRFTKRELLPELSPTIPSVAVQCNKQPLIVEISNNPNSEFLQRFGIDYGLCMQRIKLLERNNQLKAKLQEAYDVTFDGYTDSFATIYSAPFFTDTERDIRAREAAPASETMPTTPHIRIADIFSVSAETRDKARNFDLFLRAKWLNFYPELVREGDYSPSEFAKFVEYLQFRLHPNEGHNALTLDQFKTEVSKIRLEQALTTDEELILDKLSNFVSIIERRFEHLKGLVSSQTEDALLESARVEIQEIETAIALRNRDLDSEVSVQTERGSRPAQAR